mgnify:CR=1 FL=1
MRVGIIGSRTYENKRKIREMIWMLKNQFSGELTIVSGGCIDGADKYAKKYALELDCKYLEFNPAHTNRNLYSALHDAYYVDYLIAFMTDDSIGTLYTVKEAKRKGKKVVIMS